MEQFEGEEIELNPETQELFSHVDEFCRLMKLRLAEKQLEGYKGWHELDVEEVVKEIEKRVPRLKEDHKVAIGLANWCLILYVNTITIKPEDQL